jgi:peptide/nickel transport system permease protein
MLEYTVRRLALGVLTVLAVTLVLFSVMQLMPGDPIRLLADPGRVPPHRIEALRRQWGLDRPVAVQYLYWLGNLVRGDFGHSIISGQSVSVLMGSRLPFTLMLAVTALLLHYLLAVPLGLLAAVRSGSRLDRTIVVVTTALRTIPGFWLAILLMLLFAIRLRWFPISGYQGFSSLVLPVATLTLPMLGGTVRLTRAEVLETIGEPFVLTAYAKGLGHRAVRLRHVLRNALIPVTVMFFLSLPWVVGGSVIIENIFAWPGMGRLLWSSITNQDLPVVQGIIVVIAVLTVICNTIGDVISGLLDPRVRIEIEEGR